MSTPCLAMVLDYGALFQATLLMSLAAIAYTYAGYPLLLALIAVFKRRKAPSTDYRPTLSVLIAAFNEEKHIREKIEQTLLLEYPKNRLEVIVLSDASTDNTDAIVQSIRDRRVRLLRLPQRRGKTHAQNEGVKVAKGEVVVFSDATTIYESKTLLYLASNLRDPRVGAVTGRNSYFPPAGGSPTGAGTMTFWSYENIIKSLQSRIYSLSGCVGCIYAVRKSAYVPLSDDIISDLVEPLHLLKKRFRVVFEGRAQCYEETTRSNSHEFRMRVRVVTRGMFGLLTVPELIMPWRHPWISFQLISHKILRWFIPVFLILAFMSSLLAARSPWVEEALIFQVVFYILALCGLAFPSARKWKLASIPLYFCNLNGAALASLFQVLRGKRYVIWNTVRDPQRSAVFVVEPAIACEKELA